MPNNQPNDMCSCPDGWVAGNCPVHGDPTASGELDKTDIGIILSDYLGIQWNGNMCEDLLQLFQRKHHQQTRALLERLREQTQALPTWEQSTMIEAYDVLLVIDQELANLKQKAGK